LTLLAPYAQYFTQSIASSPLHQSQVESRLIVIFPESLSLWMCVVITEGSNALCPVWWREQADSQSLQPLHLVGSRSINRIPEKKGPVVDEPV